MPCAVSVYLIFMCGIHVHIPGRFAEIFTKLNSFADTISNVAKIMIYVFDGVENIVAK